MKKHIYTSFAISIMLIGAAGLFLVMVALFNTVGEDLTLNSGIEITAKIP
jgi:hypothetical protein